MIAMIMMTINLFIVFIFNSYIAVVYLYFLDRYCFSSSLVYRRRRIYVFIRTLKIVQKHFGKIARP